jgi:hypothetical protein
VACSWQKYPSGPSDPAGDILTKCNKVHETQHFGDIGDCPKDGLTREPFGPKVDSKKAEIAAYKAEIACLKAALKDCKGKKACEDRVNQEIKSDENAIKGWGGTP